MQMKKIAFFVQWMLYGGVENALIALTKELKRKGNDITIYVITNKGDFINKIPKDIHLKLIPMDNNIRINIPVGGTKITVRNHIVEKQYIFALKFILKHQFNTKRFAELNVALQKIPTLNSEYDIAVNFHMHSPFLVWYLSERVNANKKYTWIHNDLETTHYDIRKLKRYLNFIDNFFAVSHKIVNEFNYLLPEYKNKIQTAINIVPVNEIKEKADKFYPQEFSNVEKNTVILLTVGRLEEQKGYDIAIEVCEKIIKEGFKIQWFVLGEGTQKHFIEKEIKRKNIENYFHLLGTRMNPYPYFKNCDIYVQTSKHEGYVTTITEAKLFNCPIVCTDVSGAREQLKDGVNGDIAEITVESVYQKLYSLLLDQQRQCSYSFELSKETNTSEPTWLSIFS